MKTYVQPGKVIPFTAGADLPSGRVVKVGQLLGVLQNDVESGDVGQAYIEGVFECPKVSAAVIAAGESLTWDVSANTNTGAFDDNLATPAAGDVTGPTAVAFEAAGNGVTTIKVKFTGVPGTVT